MSNILWFGGTGRTTVLTWREEPVAEDRFLKLPNEDYIGPAAEEDFKRRGLDLRALLSQPHCTAEERERLDLEAELEQAHREGVCGLWAYTDYSISHDYSLHHTNGQPVKATNHSSNTSRIEALRKCAAKVRELRAERDAALVTEAVAQVAAAEERLAEACQAHGVGIPTPVLGKLSGTKWEYWFPAGSCAPYLGADTKLDAAIKAAEWVETRPLKPALPEPETMSHDARIAELKKRNWSASYTFSMQPIWEKNAEVQNHVGDSWELTTLEALREARSAQ